MRELVGSGLEAPDSSGRQHPVQKNRRPRYPRAERPVEAGDGEGFKKAQNDAQLQFAGAATRIHAHGASALGRSLLGGVGTSSLR